MTTPGGISLACSSSSRRLPACVACLCCLCRRMGVHNGLEECVYAKHNSRVQKCRAGLKPTGRSAKTLLVLCWLLKQGRHVSWA
jgi:hypothetical protein